GELLLQLSDRGRLGIELGLQGIEPRFLSVESRVQSSAVRAGDFHFGSHGRLSYLPGPPLTTLVNGHETTNDGRALIRFGDGVSALAPPDGAHIHVTYRIGVGTDGNVGSESLVHVINPGNVANFPSLVAVRNPLAAWGGIDPQPIEQVR